MQDVDRDMDFAKELRVRTRRSHALSRAAWTLTLPIAMSSPEVYRIALKAFYFVYQAIESELERLRRLYPKINAVYFPEILRANAFEDDLLYYYGPSWRTAMGPPSECTVQYVRALHDSVEREPLLIIAYCQSMYMGLFAGGQYIRSWCEKAFSLKNDQGTRAFVFPDSIHNRSAFRERYNDALNSLVLSRQERDRIIEQKKSVFVWNDKIFAEVRATTQYRSRVAVFLTFVVVLIAVAYFVVKRLWPERW